MNRNFIFFLLMNLQEFSRILAHRDGADTGKECENCDEYCGVTQTKVGEKKKRAGGHAERKTIKQGGKTKEMEELKKMKREVIEEVTKNIAHLKEECQKRDK